MNIDELEKFSRNFNGLYFKPYLLPSDRDAAYVVQSIVYCGLDAEGPKCPRREELFETKLFTYDSLSEPDFMELIYKKPESSQPLKYVLRILVGGIELYAESGDLVGIIGVLGPESRGKPAVPPPQENSEGPRSLTAEETAEINQAFQKVSYKSQLIPLDPDAAFVFHRIIDCELDAKGPKCLDRDQLFKVDLTIEGNKNRLDTIVLTMDLTYMKPGIPQSRLKYMLKIHPLHIDMYSETGNLLGRIEILERRGEPKLSEASSSIVAFYHSVKKVFDHLNALLKKCRICEETYSEHVETRRKVIHFLNNLVEKNTVYERALLLLAFREGAQLPDFKELAAKYAVDLPAFGLGRVLVLYHFPDRLELKKDAIDWLEGINPHSVLGLEALGRAKELSFQEELIVIEHVRFLASHKAVREMLERIKMTDDHLETLYKHVPLSFAIDAIESVRSVKAVETLTKYFASPDASVRYQAARGLRKLTYTGGDTEVWKAGKKAIEAQLAVEKDERVREALMSFVFGPFPGRGPSGSK